MVTGRKEKEKKKKVKKGMEKRKEPDFHMQLHTVVGYILELLIKSM